MTKSWIKVVACDQISIKANAKIKIGLQLKPYCHRSVICPVSEDSKILVDEVSATIRVKLKDLVFHRVDSGHLLCVEVFRFRNSSNRFERNRKTVCILLLGVVIAINFNQPLKIHIEAEAFHSVVEHSLFLSVNDPHFRLIAFHRTKSPRLLFDHGR